MKLDQILIVIFFLLFVSSCGGENEQQIETTLIGKWADIHDYSSIQVVDGISQSVAFPDIEYHIQEDGSYEVKNDFFGGLHRNGLWIINDQENVVEFLPETNSVDSIIELNQTYIWEIIKLENDLLEVNYVFSQDSIDGLSPQSISRLRQFEKIE